MSTYEHDDDFDSGWFAIEHISHHPQERELYDFGDGALGIMGALGQDEHGLLMDQNEDNEHGRHPTGNLLASPGAYSLDAVDTSMLWRSPPAVAPKRKTADLRAQYATTANVREGGAKPQRAGGGGFHFKKEHKRARKMLPEAAHELNMVFQHLNPTPLQTPTPGAGCSSKSAAFLKEQPPRQPVLLRHPTTTPKPDFCAPPMNPKLSQSSIVRVQKTAKIRDVINHELALCRNPATAGGGNKLPLAGIRRHMKQEKGTSLISSETPVILSKVCELFLKECCEAAVRHSTSNELSPSDFARAFRLNPRFNFLTK